MWTRVNGGSSTTGSGSSSVQVLTSWGLTPGNLLVALFGQFSHYNGAATIGDGTGNIYSLAGSASSVTNFGIYGWTCPITTGGSLPVAVSVTSSDYLTLLVGEYACAATIGAVHGFVSATGNSSVNPSPGSIVASATDLMITTYNTVNQAGSASSIASPFSLAPGQVNASGHVDMAEGYALDQTTSQTPIWAIGTGQSWSAIGFAVKGSTGIGIPGGLASGGRHGGTRRGHLTGGRL